jgi:hypothetical protein
MQDSCQVFWHGLCIYNSDAIFGRAVLARLLQGCVDKCVILYCRQGSSDKKNLEPWLGGSVLSRCRGVRGSKNEILTQFYGNTRTQYPLLIVMTYVISVGYTFLTHIFNDLAGVWIP